MTQRNDSTDPSPDQVRLSIGQVAQQAGRSASSIRYYESIGVLAQRGCPVGRAPQTLRGESADRPSSASTPTGCPRRPGSDVAGTGGPLDQAPAGRSRAVPRPYRPYWLDIRARSGRERADRHPGGCQRPGRRPSGCRSIAPSRIRPRARTVVQDRPPRRRPPGGGSRRRGPRTSGQHQHSAVSAPVWREALLFREWLRYHPRERDARMPR
jgi:hypothetical protein